MRRDIAAARASWERARQIADALPGDDPERSAMRIAPRTKLCGTAWRGVQPNIPTLVGELRELCGVAGDNASLAIGIVALALQGGHRGHLREEVGLASEAMTLLESMADPTLTMGAASRRPRFCTRRANRPKHCGGRRPSSIGLVASPPNVSVRPWDHR